VVTAAADIQGPGTTAHYRGKPHHSMGLTSTHAPLNPRDLVTPSVGRAVLPRPNAKRDVDTRCCGMRILRWYFGQKRPGPRFRSRALQRATLKASRPLSAWTHETQLRQWTLSRNEFSLHYSRRCSWGTGPHSSSRRYWRWKTMGRLGSGCLPVGLHSGGLRRDQVLFWPIGWKMVLSNGACSHGQAGIDEGLLTGVVRRSTSKKRAIGRKPDFSALRRRLLFARRVFPPAAAGTRVTESS